jgi:two-component system, cell cycle sensor histidine kinase and response regulator CckA
MRRMGEAKGSGDGERGDVTGTLIKTDDPRLSAALELMSDGVWDWDVPGDVVTGSQRLRDILGLSPDAPFPDAVEWQALIHPDDTARVHAAFEELLTGSGRFSVEYRLRTARGVRITHDRARVVERDESGRPLRILGLVTDLTDIRSAEAALGHGQRINLLGSLMSGVVHDVNNLLASILGNAHLLHGGAARRPDEAIADIDYAVEAASSLSRNLLAFSKKEAPAPRRIHMSRHLTTVGRLLRTLVGGRGSLEITDRSEDAHVMIDPSEMDQIVMNLVVNARDALPDAGGKITLEADVLERSPPPGWPDAYEGSFLRLSMIDNGAGMGAEIQERIFEPFFTTKQDVGGTGLGLATVRDVVARRGGFIEVESAPLAGATFRIHLPRASAAPEAEARRSGAWVRGHELVVLVEDDDLVRPMMTSMLQSLGYRVEAFATGEACMAAMGRLSSARVLLTDIGLPGIGGYDLVGRVQEERQDMKAIVMSSRLASARDDQHDAEEAGVPFLLKPFRPADLGRAIRRVLDQPASRE